MNTTFREEHQHPGSFNPVAAAKILDGLDESGWLTTCEEAGAPRPVEFVFRWEEEFARILDEHQVSWQYEPRTFAVEWDEEGNFVDSFTPDFYLPVRDMYVELIAPDDRASAAKARKVRLLARLHPEINIELLRVGLRTSERLIEVFDYLFGSFDSNRYADQAVGDSKPLAVFRRHA